MAALREFPHAGGLMSYGPDLAQIYRRGATSVDMVTGAHEVAALGSLLTDHPAARGAVAQRFLVVEWQGWEMMTSLWAGCGWS